MATEETKKPTANKTTSANALKEQNELLQKQIEEMKAQMELLMSSIVNKNEESVKEETRKERNIKFINMTPGTFVLRGSRFWEIEGQFNSRNFLEREARLIVNNMPNAIASGMIYIADPEFVKENELEEIYKNILSDTQLKGLFEESSEKIIEFYKSASNGQKDLIVKMIKAKLENGDFVDANVCVVVGKMRGEDLLHYSELSKEE